MNKFYVTTPIYYPSANAHIGHCYSTIAADVIARYKRMRGFDVLFSTGTDEHGEKIEICAKKAGKSPQEFVDHIVENFKNLWKILDISYDVFIRTTDLHHIESVKKIFNNLYEKGDIYKGNYSGWYCIPCESFFTEVQLRDGKCPDCGRDVIKQNEEAYFFRLSKYQYKVLSLLKNSDFVSPESRKNEMIKFVEEGLQDLCVSRSSFSWGIPVEFDPSHVVYVWIDALTNYITLAGYPDDMKKFGKFWPADVHIMAKEIVRFHAVIWPAILMALDLPVPRKIFGHGWILYGSGEKMSKSKGNIVDPFVLCNRYGTDSLRYFLLREVPFGSDGTFSNEAFIKRLNSDLANDLGNLVSRSTALVEKYFDSNLIFSEEQSDDDKELINLATNLTIKCEDCIENFKFSNYLAEIWNLISKCNRYIDVCAPWNLSKDSSKHSRLSTVLYNVLESLRIISILLEPVIPSSSKKIQKQIGINDSELVSWESSKKWGTLPKNIIIDRSNALFPRLDCEEELKKLESLDQNEEKNKKNDIENLISIDDFTKIKLIVAKIVDCKKVEKSKKLLKLNIYDGEINRTVVSGISQYYLPDQLIGHNVVLVSNLAPAKLCGVESNGMILASKDKKSENVKVIFVDEMVPGSIIR